MLDKPAQNNSRGMMPAAVQEEFTSFLRDGTIRPELVTQITAWANLQVNRYGSGLERHDVIQSIWEHVLRSVMPSLRKMPRRKTKAWRSFVLVSIRNYIFTMQKRRVIGPRTISFDEAIHGKEI
jgi:hypothetical protein